MRRGTASLACVTAAALGAIVTVAPGKAAASTATRSASTTTYSATETIPVPPASTYAGSGDGDGWGVALSATDVYNVFHHSGSLQMACHRQSDASQCWSPETITDQSGNGFATSGQPGLWLNQATGRLYVYATRTSDNTGGVVCIDTTQAAANSDPFCGFTALTATGDSPLTSGGISALSDPVAVGSRWYSFNYVDGASANGAQNALLCFDLSTLGPCPSQPFAVPLGSGTVSNLGFPSPSIAAIGSQIIIPVSFAGFSSSELACYDAQASGACAGNWPVSTTALGYPASANTATGGGAPFPRLTSVGALSGVCLPISGAPCFSLTGGSVPSPSNLASAVPPNPGWDGPAIVMGPRVYVPGGSFSGTDQVSCYDYSQNATCANFPKTFSNLGLLYSINPDPQRPTCIWVNSDSGADQIQNFDAYTAGACGQGAIRVLASSLVVPNPTCTPTSYTSLQVLSPQPSAYTSGTVSFQDPDGNPITGAADKALDSTGTVSLTGLNLNTNLGLPQFLITLKGVQGTPGSVEVKLTWTGVNDPSCTPGNSGGGGPQAQVLFLHGVREKAGDKALFGALFNEVKAAVPGVKISNFEYFQDKAGKAGSGCNPKDPGQQPVVIPAATAGLPYNTSQNKPPYCDSQGDLGQNAFQLDQTIRQLYQQNKEKVILVGYSMGGETIRSFLAYSTSVNNGKGDGVANGMIDSVVMMHGVQQGSWAALAAPGLQAHLPSWLGTPIDDLINKVLPDPGRLGVQEFNPRSAYIHWVIGHSGNLPKIPYYNTFGDERVIVQHCYLPFHRGCINADFQNWGDVVLDRGTDSPTQTTTFGGARFLPTGYTAHSWQWGELYQVNWNPLADPQEVGALTAIVTAPEQHVNVVTQQNKVTVRDCRTGAPISEDKELARVISARLTGSTYACNPAFAP